MDKYLYKISTKRSDVWSSITPKPVYFVAESKEQAYEWATKNISSGLSIAKITRLAVQVGVHVFAAL